MQTTRSKQRQLLRRTPSKNGPYTYKNDKLFKTVTLTKSLSGDLIGKSIAVVYSLTDQPASVPVFEKTEGVYKFDQNDQLIYEARDMKYRTRENGIWSEWKHFRY
jgi:hypothetical protein